MHARGAALWLGVVAAAGLGCGSNDCAETATCDAPADGSAGGDVVGSDVTVDGGEGEAGNGSGGSSGSGSGRESGLPLGDSGAADDAMTLPDVAFIDATACGSGSTCIDAVPIGWSGPLILSDQTGGPPTPTPPACPSSYPNDAFDGYASPTSPSAVCTCSCGGLSGGSCGDIQLVGYSDTGCATACSDEELPLSECVASACSNTGSVTATEPLVQGGTCTPSGTSMNPPSAWAETARACQPQTVGGGCSGSQVCVKSPPSPFSVKMCIMHAGSTACPSGAYTQQKILYTSTQDSRSCGPACTCTAPSTLACTGGTAVLFAGDTSGGGCSGTTMAVPVDGQCDGVGIGGMDSLLYQEATTQPTPPTGASCTASSPQPTGAVTPSGPTTLCCQP